MQRFSSSILQRSEVLSRKYLSAPTQWSFHPPLKKAPAAAFTAVLFSLILVTAVFISSFRMNTSNFPINNSANQTVVFTQKHNEKPRKRIEFPLNCTIGLNQTQTCSTNYPKRFEIEENDLDPSLKPVCPEYFRWIHEDLRSWKENGITRDMVERAKKTAHFRLVIVNGKVYVENYKKSIQTRDVFTIWGILQLLRRYPGRIPDLELMFDCNDRPVIRSKDYRGPNKTGPPPLFRYCGDRWTEDIVFPDWSFWGWAEINIKPWEKLLKEIKEGNERTKWMDREPYAYWKGNPFVAETRQDLLKCNVSDTHDWNARLHVQDWIAESQQGFKQSDLASQCTHKYKIYIEGYAWSVSEKYILACDSVTLLVKPTYYDFFLRSLQPTQHYWPIRDVGKCKSIKHAVDWGNNHKQKAQAIGKAASDFIQQDLKMDYVYDYMFHLLNEYAKLLKFKPRVPEGAVEFCSETMACPRSESEKKFMMESLVKSPSITNPCTLPPPFRPKVLMDFYRKKINSIRQVEKWENKYWENPK
ncbi:O-glucosyltransferase rumi-like [Quillaja saponaria]|uniref:O-glucosyltransferase rumi-like n=1 Tax=Quillaja saponaria TaxID=32244 RepID=A0AAD7PEY3_QUISA|nr:O-glucosyltransferase rumi-like [Quillaja saponaria]KAJ7952335.1 O-glucosyltransferase rumi-like [Quillaja saponaria]